MPEVPTASAEEKEAAASSSGPTRRGQEGRRAETGTSDGRTGTAGACRGLRQRGAGGQTSFWTGGHLEPSPRSRLGEVGEFQAKATTNASKRKKQRAQNGK